MADAPDIFISYRRGDAASAARLHRNNIQRRFGSAVKVFLDVRSIEPGETYADELREALRGSKLMLAVAGRSYASELRRREHEVDWVREELLEARAAGVPIWPVMVDGQQPFGADDLPEAVRWLAELNAITIPTDTSDDGEDLLVDIDRFLTEREASLSFEDPIWGRLIDDLRAGRCVPIIGTELGQFDYSGPHPITLQRSTGEGGAYSLFGGRDLPRVAQALATMENDAVPRQKVGDWAEGQTHEPVQADHPYAVLAGLGLPMYVSTSYEDGLARYIEGVGGRRPQRVVYSADRRAIDGDLDEPSTESPIVLQLMGDYDEDVNSIVVTEDDFFHLLVKMVTDDHFFPIECLDQLMKSSLLFVGFELSDWRFRVLLRGLVQSLKSTGKVYAVVSAPREGEPLDENVASKLVHSYLTRQLPEIPRLNARVHYGGVEQFTRELAARLDRAAT